MHEFDLLPNGKRQNCAKMGAMSHGCGFTCDSFISISLDADQHLNLWSFGLAASLTPVTGASGAGEVSKQSWSVQGSRDGHRGPFYR